MIKCPYCDRTTPLPGTQSCGCGATVFDKPEDPTHEGKDYRDARMQGVILKGLDLRNADFRNARLQGAILTGCDLRGAKFDGARMQGAILTGARPTALRSRALGCREWSDDQRGSSLLHSPPPTGERFPRLPRPRRVPSDRGDHRSQLEGRAPLLP